MAYFQIADFRGGLDVRRSRDLAPPGTLRVLKNAFVNEGAEIEKRPAFVKDTALSDLLQGATVIANIAGGSPADADGRPIGPFPGLIGSAVGFAGREAALWAGGQTINSAVAGTPAPNAHYTQLLDDGGANVGFINRLKTLSVTEFDGTLFLIASINDTGRFFNFAQAASAPVTTNETLGPTGGTFAITHRNKIITVDADRFRGSHLGLPTEWTIPDAPNVGAFVTILRAQESRIGEGRSLAGYFDELAIFGERGIQFWSMDPDPLKNQYKRTIPRDGVLAPRAVSGFGDGDVFFLAKTGIRSLQARDSSNIAKIGDVGSPIDGVLRPILRASGSSGSAVPEALMDVHPLTGQLWVAIGRTIYVLSSHPESKILAWSTFEIPSPTETDSDGWIEDMAEVNGTIIVRNRAREVFTYGGPLFDQYDSTAAVMETPHLSFGTPGHPKQITGIDVGCTGRWKIEASYTSPNIDPDTGLENPIAWDHIADINGSTYDAERIPITAEARHIAIRATSIGSLAAKLGEILVHFEKGKPD